MGASKDPLFIFLIIVHCALEYQENQKRRGHEWKFALSLKFLLTSMRPITRARSFFLRELRQLADVEPNSPRAFTNFAFYPGRPAGGGLPWRGGRGGGARAAAGAGAARGGGAPP